MASSQALPKKPRLSLQIKTVCSPVTRSSRSYAVDPKDPTAFNTLSNVYVTTIERATPSQHEPITAINTLQAFSLTTPVERQDPKHRVVTPYVASYPETPSSDTAPSPHPGLEINYPSTMTATPPLSAGPMDSNTHKAFSFSPADISAAPARIDSLQPDKRALARPQTLAELTLQAPYTHPRSLHSILRNSPLPPPTAIPPPSPRRQSRRLQDRANRRVCYNNPLTQEIVTNKYTKSHIDLLVEEASPHSPPCVPPQPQSAVDLASAFTPNEIQDGGQTPGPFEDMRRRMTGLAASGTPLSPSGPKGISKRKKREKKRRWVWTIGQEDDGDDDNIGGSIAALRAEAAKAKDVEEIKTPVTAIKAPLITFLTAPTPSTGDFQGWSGILKEDNDVEMSDTSSCLTVPEESQHITGEMDLDIKTPIARQDEESQVVLMLPENPLSRLGSSPALKRDSPVPPDMLRTD
ncbi:glucan 1 4-alpha-glucosidase [Fusarium subglutinans]|uniref:Glucan 1 4-alpha-glucosidase n=1 Tax=Gibberella subglutinans TaxID=42677 RepID=A0A8H5V1B8_GIBSU|nr:glucan 1 4-alpha-glucosidase [Fusarium subglutinans]KAF5607202.1 glucan 1 4-alpha-glucosidase [Fusarium subglutinans]